MEDIISKYYDNIKKDKNHRLKSWEHCYCQFSVMFKNNKLTNTDIDYLSLHLAFYLASWGMYRGSSFILQKDYKVFYPIIELLFKNRDKFNDSKIKYLLNQENDDSIKKYVKDYFVFDAELSKLLNEIRNSVKELEEDLWIDKGNTALCPFCMVDVVIPESDKYPLTKEFLQKAHDYWFEAVDDSFSRHAASLYYTRVQKYWDDFEEEDE